jgi:hypothetical protein
MAVNDEIIAAWNRLQMAGGWSQAAENRATYRSQVVDDVQYIDFQGSVERADWLMDFNFFPRGGLHGGYFEALFSVFNELKITAGLPQVWAGYSCGGAFALILASEIGGLLREHIKVFTFAAPRVAWKKPLNQYPNVEIHNVLCSKDIVPRLPPKFLGFQENIGDEMTFYPPKGVTFISGHSPQTYTDFVEKLKAGGEA